MNVKDSKYLSNVKSRFKQFGRYVDQGRTYILKGEKIIPLFSNKNDEDWHSFEDDQPQNIYGRNNRAGNQNGLIICHSTQHTYRSKDL